MSIPNSLLRTPLPPVVTAMVGYRPSRQAPRMSAAPTPTASLADWERAHRRREEIEDAAWEQQRLAARDAAAAAQARGIAAIASPAQAIAEQPPQLHSNMPGSQAAAGTPADFFSRRAIRACPYHRRRHRRTLPALRARPWACLRLTASTTVASRRLTAPLRRSLRMRSTKGPRPCGTSTVRSAGVAMPGPPCGRRRRLR